MFGEINIEEKEKAIQYQMDNIPKDCLEKVWIAVQNKECWSWSVNMHFGMYIRNTLRKGGYNWGPHTLDNLWGMLIAEAARRHVESHKENSLN
jgi:hypothetical protein